MADFDKFEPVTYYCEQYGVSRFQAPFVNTVAQGNSGVTIGPTTMQPGWYSYILAPQAPGLYGSTAQGCSTGNPEGNQVVPWTGTDGNPLSDNEFTVYELMYLMQAFSSAYAPDLGFTPIPPTGGSGYNEFTFVSTNVSGRILN
jgi:hypothetical protein